MRATDQALDEARGRIAKLEAELQKMVLRGGELERVIAAYRAVHHQLADAIGEDPGTGSELVGCVVLKLKALTAERDDARRALAESPAAAELLRAAPFALRFRDAEYDTLRAALTEACDIAGRWIGGDDPVCDRPAQRDEARIVELRRLTEAT